jgi:hypothetical protein
MIRRISATRNYFQISIGFFNEVCMRKIIMLMLPLGLIFSCGNDNPTGNPNQGIVVTVQPSRIALDFGTTYPFTAYVQGTENTTVGWYVNNVAGGDSINGLIDLEGNYRAPLMEPPGADSVSIEAHLAADPSKIGLAWAVLVDPSKIYVNFLGSDTTGVGSLHRPYRTVTKALTRVQSNMQILV